MPRPTGRHGAATSSAGRTCRRCAAPTCATPSPCRCSLLALTIRLLTTARKEIAMHEARPQSAAPSPDADLVERLIDVLGGAFYGPQWWRDQGRKIPSYV